MPDKKVSIINCSFSFYSQPMRAQTLHPDSWSWRMISTAAPNTGLEKRHRKHFPWPGQIRTDPLEYQD